MVCIAALQSRANRSSLSDVSMDTKEIADPPAARPLSIAGEALRADASGALWHESERALIVADLHLEKGSSYAQRAQMLPPYDTRATLKRLADLVERYAPRSVIALGDSFHDGQAAQRLSPEDRESIARLTRSVGHWIWVEGNHDPLPPVELGGETAPELRLGALTLRHLPTEGHAPGELAGHLHPCARVSVRGRRLRRRCLASDGVRAVLPAFGAYAGGLDVTDAAFARVFGGTPDVWILGRDQVWPVRAGKLI